MPYFLKSTSVNKYNVTNYAKKKKKNRDIKTIANFERSGSHWGNR